MNARKLPRMGFWGQPLAACEPDTDAPFASPDHVSALPRLPGHYVQGDLMRNASRTHKLECRATRREVANSAIDAVAIELNRPGLQDSLPSC
jgi:hypothetical protein